jgi:hypothetical protein
VKRVRTPEYIAWVNMIQRCENRALSGYHLYGAAGVRISARWRANFSNFLADMGPRPSRDHSLDRHPDPFGNYEPCNCRWASETEQQRNRRNNRKVTVGGRTRCLSEWAEETGAKRETIARRLNVGVDGARAVSPQLIPTRYQFRGEMLSARQIAQATGIPGNSLLRRIYRHGSVDVAILEWQKNGRGKRPGKVSK